MSSLHRDHANLLCIFKRLFNVTARRLDNPDGKKLIYNHQSYRVLPALEPVSSDSKKGILGQAGSNPPPGLARAFDTLASRGLDELFLQLCCYVVSVFCSGGK